MYIVVSGEEVYTLAVTVFNSRNHGDGELTLHYFCAQHSISHFFAFSSKSCSVSQGSVEIAASLFEYAGDLGDANALYTFAQLLRTGIILYADTYI